MVSLPPLDKDGTPTDKPADTISVKCVRTPRATQPPGPSAGERERLQLLHVPHACLRPQGGYGDGAQQCEGHRHRDRRWNGKGSRWNATYYADKTFQVMAASIGAERDKARATIIKRSSNELSDYTFFEALEDAHNFDDSCSLRRGLESLSNAAATQKEGTEQKLDAARNTTVTASTRPPASVATADAANQQ